MPASPADTLRILPGSEAFPGSLLLAPTRPAEETARELAQWSDSPVNCLLIIAFTILTMLYLRRLVSILPSLFAGMTRWRAILAQEASIRLSRDRTAFALVMVVPFCLVVSRFDLYPVRYPALPDPGIKTCMTVGIFALYALLRGFLIRVAEPRRINRDLYRIANYSGYSFFILMTLFAVLTAGFCLVLGINDLAAKKILYCEIAAFFSLFLVRKTQIMSNACNQLTAFLYLCGLEIFPAILLVVSAIIF